MSCCFINKDPIKIYFFKQLMKTYILLRSLTTASNFYNDRFSSDTKELFICFGLWWNVVKHPSEKSQFGTKLKKKKSAI